MRILGVLAVLIAASGCIPSRDNPYDPSLQPRASLVVKIRSGDYTTDVESQVGGISSVFVLDAHDSTDKGGHGLPKKIEFDIGTGSFDHAANEDFDDPDTATDERDGILDSLVLSSAGFYQTPGIVLTADLFTGDDGVPGTGIYEHQFRVRVTAENGNEAIAEVPVVIQNSRPSVASVDLFVAASGAPPVLLDACNDLLADCAAKDPDGDKLYYEWTLERGVDPVAGSDDADNRRLEFTANDNRGWEYRLTAIDGVTEQNPAGLARSLQGRYRVFRSGAFWAGLTQPSRLLRVYPDFSARGSFRMAGGPVSFMGGAGVPPAIEADGSGGAWVAVLENPDWVLHRLDGNFDGEALSFAPVTLPSNHGFPADSYRPMVAVDDGVCLLMKDVNEPVFERYRVLRVADDGTIEQNVPVDAASGSYYAPILLPAGGDACLAVGEELVRVDAQGASNPVPTVTFGSVPDAALVNGELWVAEDDGFGRKLLFLPLTATATQEVQGNVPIFPDRLLPHPSGTGILAHSNDSALYQISFASGAFAFVDEATRGLPDIQSASPISWPASVDLQDAAFWHVDPSTYDLRRWVLRNDAWESSGSVPIEDVLEVSAQGTWVALHVDPETGRAFSFVYQQGGTGRFIQVPPHLHRLDIVPFTMSAAQRFSVDRTSGALYYSDCLSNTTQGFCPDAKGFHRLDAEGHVTLTNDSSTQLTLATAKNDNGFWAARNVIGTEPGPDYGTVVAVDLVEFDRDGVEERSFPLDPDFLPVSMSIGEDGTLCYVTRSPPTMVTQSGSGTGGRIKDGVHTPFSDSIECARDAGVADDGSCWFVGTPTGNCEGMSQDRTRLVRYAPGASPTSTPVVDVAPSGFNTGTKFTVDPRPGPQGGYWLVDVSTSTTSHYGPDGGFLGSYNGISGVIAMSRVCQGGGDECLETWRAEGTSLVRGTAKLDDPPLETIPLGTTGFVKTFSLSPYVISNVP